jgi:hypothetical protein
MKYAFAILACGLAAGSARAQTERPTPPEEREVLAVVDRFMRAVTRADAKEFDAIRMDNALATIQSVTPEGTTRIARRPMNSSNLRAGLRERYWDPTALVRQNIAVVWAPYEFWVDGKTTHCGVDVFDLAKQDGAWRIAHVMYTVEPNACPELRPKDASRIRPPQ